MLFKSFMNFIIKDLNFLMQDFKKIINNNSFIFEDFIVKNDIINCNNISTQFLKSISYSSIKESTFTDVLKNFQIKDDSENQKNKNIFTKNIFILLILDFCNEFIEKNKFNINFIKDEEFFKNIQNFFQIISIEYIPIKLKILRNIQLKAAIEKTINQYCQTKGLNSCLIKFDFLIEKKENTYQFKQNMEDLIFNTDFKNTEFLNNIFKNLYNKRKKFHFFNISQSENILINNINQIKIELNEETSNNNFDFFEVQTKNKEYLCILKKKKLLLIGENAFIPSYKISEFNFNTNFEHKNKIYTDIESIFTDYIFEFSKIIYPKEDLLPKKPKILPHTKKINSQILLKNELDLQQSAIHQKNFFQKKGFEKSSSPFFPIEQPKINNSNAFKEWGKPYDSYFRKVVHVSRNQTQYDHQFIIEMEKDGAINDLANKIFLKHPDKTTWIQVDAKTKQFRVIFGNLNKLTNKSRVYIAGHGSAYLNCITKSYHLTAFEVVHLLFKENLMNANSGEKLMTPLIKVCPQKIGIIACQIAAQNYREIEEQFCAIILKEVFKIFREETEVVGFTNNISILPSGGKRLVKPGMKASYKMLQGEVQLNIFAAKRNPVNL